jgi:prophage tail gpP-like protein/LysM repeat protein
MPVNPQPGKQYTIVSGDQLRLIAGRAYGNRSKWPIIWKANKTRLRSGNPNLIFPGEVIIIPRLNDRKPVDKKTQTKTSSAQLINKDKDLGEFTLLIADTEVPVEGAKIIRTMDTAADGWTATIGWTPGLDRDADAFLLPYVYPEAAAYLGPELAVNGLLYTVKNAMTKEGIKKELEGFSYTADLVDSTIKPPYEKRNVTLEQRALDIAEGFEIDVEKEFITDTGGKFSRMTADKTETVFEHLKKYAGQRGLLISSTPAGNLLLTKANTNSKPVTTLEEMKPLPEGWQAGFDGRKRFNAYKAIGSSPRKSSKTATAKDDVVPRSRFLTFTANNTTKGNIQKAADWKRGKSLADTLTIPFPVSDWYYEKAGKKILWRPNTLVTVVSDAIHVPQGYDFLIRSVEYTWVKSGRSCLLNLVPPEVYTGEKIVEPWKNTQK